MHKHNIRNDYQVHKSDADGLPPQSLLLQARILIAHQRYDEALKQDAPFAELYGYLQTAQQALEELTALMKPEPPTAGAQASASYGQLDLSEGSDTSLRSQLYDAGFGEDGRL